jgi:monoamine oxidase
LLTGWLAGPNSLKYKNSSPDKILDLGLVSLSNIFKINIEFLKKELVNSKVINWPADPFARGAYSYWTPESKEAYMKFREPIGNRVFFAGEACRESDSATVEGALASGIEAANMILNGN